MARSITIDSAWDNNDFGFSAVSEDELKALERKLQVEVKQKSAALEEIERTYEEKLDTLYRMVMPLLHNLAKDAEKDYIFWPGRQEKMRAFIDEVENVVNG